MLKKFRNCVTNFHQKCICEGGNNDLRSLRGNNEQNEIVNDRSCTCYRSFKYFCGLRKTYESLVSMMKEVNKLQLHKRHRRAFGDNEDG